jgi:hypothetical protein
MVVRSALIAWLLTAAAPACSTHARTSNRPAAAVTLTTDSSEYHAVSVNPRARDYGFRLVARLENETDSSVILSRCTPESRTPIYGLVNTDTTVSPHELRSAAAYSPMWPCVGHDRHIEIRARQTRVDTLELRGPNAVDGSTKEPLGVFEGIFRLQYERRPCRVATCFAASLGPIVSNAFRVRVDR